MSKLRRGFKTWSENAARGFRRELGLSPFDRLNPFDLARHLSVPVWAPSDVPGLRSEHVHRLTIEEGDCWSALTIRDGPHSLVIINDGHPPTRINNSLAHELSHIILGHKPPMMIQSPDGSMIMTDYDPVQEEEAGTLGGALLVPREALLRRYETGETDQEAAVFFDVSLALVRERKNKTGIGVQIARRGTWRP